MFAEINARLPSVAYSLYQYLKFSEGATPEVSFRDDLATSSLPSASHRVPALSRRLFPLAPPLVCNVEAQYRMTVDQGPGASVTPSPWHPDDSREGVPGAEHLRAQARHPERPS